MDTTIIGAGRVGVQIAYGLILEGFNIKNRIDLIDIDKQRLIGEIADLKQASEVLRKTNEISAVEEPRESDFYIITAGKCGSDRMALYEDNKKIIIPYLEAIARVRREDSVIMMVTNPSTMLAKLALDYVPLVIPIGNKLDNARLRLCRVNAPHEKPDIQEKYKEVASNKGYTNFGVASEVLTYIELYYGFTGK
jgi:malate/lactate dehydrogenase